MTDGPAFSNRRMILKWVELRGPLSAVWKTAIAFPNQPNSKPTIPNQTNQFQPNQPPAGPAPHEAQAALGDSFPNLPRRRHRRLHFALPQQLDLGAPHALGKLRVAGGFRDLFQSLPTQPRPENCSAFLE